MRRIQPRRPSIATVIASTALFVSLGGGAYAAMKIDTGDIKAEAVTGAKIDKRTIKGSRVARDSLKGKKIKEHTLGKVPSAKEADDSKLVDGRNASCEDGTQFFAGACWETSARAAATWPEAAATCAGAGGTLPGAGALRAAALSGFTLAATDEFASEIDRVLAADDYTVVTVSSAGVVNLTSSTDPKGYRCVIPLVH